MEMKPSYLSSASVNQFAVVALISRAHLFTSTFTLIFPPSHPIYFLAEHLHLRTPDELRNKLQA